MPRQRFFARWQTCCPHSLLRCLASFLFALQFLELMMPFAFAASVFRVFMLFCFFLACLASKTGVLGVFVWMFCWNCSFRLVLLIFGWLLMPSFFWSVLPNFSVLFCPGNHAWPNYNCVKFFCNALSKIKP